MRDMTALMAMVGAFAGASIPHLEHPTLGNVLWLAATSFASAAIALFVKAVLDKRKARQHAKAHQETGDHGGDCPRDGRSRA
jgi:formate-dependent nitrite reductase membrane component NrfD